VNKNINTGKFNKCGIDQLTCPDCSIQYIGQTGRRLHVVLKEHFQGFK